MRLGSKKHARSITAQLCALRSKTRRAPLKPSAHPKLPSGTPNSITTNMSDTFYTDHEIEHGVPEPLERSSSEDSDFSLLPSPKKTAPAAPATSAKSGNSTKDTWCTPRHSLYAVPPKDVSPRTTLSERPHWLNQPAVMPQQRQADHAYRAPAVPHIADLTMPAPAAMHALGATSDEVHLTEPPANSARTAALPPKTLAIETSQKPTRKGRIVWTPNRNEVLVRQVRDYAETCTAAANELHSNIQLSWPCVLKSCNLSFKSTMLFVL